LTEENADALASHVNHLFHGKVNAFRNKEFVDIIPDGCSKGMGIDIVRNILKIDTFAGIGDSMNDSPMLENVDIAFTFPYAPKALQEKASQIVNSVAEAIHSMV
jgi:hydroxymethylpyrimidine pyrophosphatase-like HAD family hydrolase